MRRLGLGPLGLGSSQGYIDLLKGFTISKVKPNNIPSELNCPIKLSRGTAAQSSLLLQAPVKPSLQLWCVWAQRKNNLAGPSSSSD